MFHPLISDLSTLSKEDFATKIVELRQRATYLSYHRPFDAIHLQLQTLIRVYSNELAKRNNKPTSSGQTD
jgi:hypothetical protein